ncbi:hypothetical protein [Halostella pelagica]|uniref:hypothetical protein n=1 Tax=Halostella pelagica TaxID=2583824 RepID=UPI0010816654|nr:hypothetical protein [Halostella pelagica]
MTDELTADGILTDDGNVTLLDYVDLHGQPVHVGPDRVIFRDEHGHELSDWSAALGADRDGLSATMHKLAREVYQPDEPGDPWSRADPVVFDADTFRRDNFEAIAMLLRRGCSPAEAFDLFATTDQRWTQTDWGEWRGVSQQNVSGNVSDGRDALGEN